MGLGYRLQAIFGKFLSEKQYIWVGQNVCHWFRKCECDVIGINKSLYLVEIEVKISNADFKADAKKSRWEPMKSIVKDGVIDTKSKLLNITRFPNRFYYGCPTGIISSLEVPPWAGLIYVDPDTEAIEIIKPAPLLHNQKVNLLKSLKYVARRSMRREFDVTKPSRN